MERQLPSSFAPNSESLSPPHNPPRRRRTANMSPVLCVPQCARPLFEGLWGLCVGVPSTSLPPHRPRRSRMDVAPFPAPQQACLFDKSTDPCYPHLISLWGIYKSCPAKHSKHKQRGPKSVLKIWLGTITDKMDHVQIEKIK